MRPRRLEEGAVPGALPISRRRFLLTGAAAGAGLVLGVTPFGAISAAGGATAPEITPWLVIRPDDTIVLRLAFADLGQGALTGLAQLLAEELECDFRRIAWEYVSPGANIARNRIWGELITGGSASVLLSHEALRKAGAAARTMLVEAAADAWDVPLAECTVSRGVVSHPGWNRRATYGQLARLAARREVPKDVKLKDTTDWTIIGKPMKRLDSADKVTGRFVYGADFRLPGMLNAAIRACPVFGGKVKRFDAEAALRVPGVRRVMRVGDSAVAVIADTWWRASSALDAVRIEWDEGEHADVSSASIDAMLVEGLGAETSFVHAKNGDAPSAIANAAKRVDAVYEHPFQNHACLEPMNATALRTRERCEVWCGTQDPERALKAAAAASGLPIAQCEVHVFPAGGGFGRRQLADYVTQAVTIAKELPDVPVKLLWSREEDMTQGRYHPIMKARLSGGIAAGGDLAGLSIRLSGQSVNAALAPQELENGMDPWVFEGWFQPGKFNSLQYTIANLHIDHAMRNTHLPPGPWRGVNTNHNAIFLECFVDELAHAAGQDALAFRRRLMADFPKALAVLEAVAARGGWGEQPPAGRHRGLAHFRSRGSNAAALAEISVIDEARVKVHRVVLALDCGTVVNPAQVERQIAGAVAFNLSALFLQACTVRNGRIAEDNFDSYDSMRIAQMPHVDAIVMPSGGFWGGVGEPPTCVAAPAVLNAYFAATGKRIRSLPLAKHGIRMV
jgi:isoquinoline 1-oxidoreductase beta subunit